MHYFCQHHSVSLITVALCVVFAPLNPTHAAAALNTQTQHSAAAVAQATVWTSSRAKTPEAHPLGVQTLSVEKQENKSSTDTALVRVYQFHYPLMQARMVVVDSNNESVVTTRAISTVHLPLNETEISYSQRLLMRDDTVVGLLREEQSRRGLSPFSSISELDVKASIYEPLNDTHACSRQRCALLSLFDHTNTVFSVEPVINLQSLQVLLLKSP